MSGTFRAVVFPEPNRAELQEFPIRELQLGEMLVRTTASGISVGTEYLALCGEFPGQEFPAIPGYQSVGIVEQVADDVVKFKPGDRVTIGISETPEGYHFGAGVSHLSHAIISAGPTGYLKSGPVVIPDHVSDNSVSYMVLVSTAQMGVEMAKIRKGDLVAVVGQGILGQLVAQLCGTLGATVYTSDLSEKRVALSGEHSANRAFHLDVEEFDKELRAVQSKGADVVFETTGNTKVFERALTLARDWGTFVCQGHYPGQLTFRYVNAHGRHLTMVFPCGWGDIWDSIHAMDRGLVNIDPLITDVIKPEEAPAFYDRIARRESGFLGVVIDWT